MDQREQTDLVMRCIAAGVGDDDATRLNGLTESQWGRLVDLSGRLGIGPQFAKAVRAAGPAAAVPAAVGERLRREHLACAASNLHLYHELSTVLPSLGDSGVGVIVLKGALLAEVVYDEIALRPMGDVDLLVRQEDMPAVEAALSQIGTGAGRGAHHADEGCPYHLAFTCPGGTIVEIHWDLVRPDAPFDIDLDELWGRARPVQIAGARALSLSPEDLILHLCVHASYGHTFSMGPRQLCDLRETVGHYGGRIDWPSLIAAAERYGIRAYVYYPLLLARKLLGADVPDEALGGLAPATPDPALVDMLIRHTLDATAMEVPGFWGTWVSLHAASRAPGLCNKVAAVWRRVFPPARRIRRIYNLPADARWIAPYYVRRIVDVVRIRWRQILHWLCRTPTSRRLLSRERAKETIGAALAAEQTQGANDPEPR